MIVTGNLIIQELKVEPSITLHVVIMRWVVFRKNIRYKCSISADINFFFFLWTLNDCYWLFRILSCSVILFVITISISAQLSAIAVRNEHMAMLQSTPFVLLDNVGITHFLPPLYDFTSLYHLLTTSLFSEWLKGTLTNNFPFLMGNSR